MILYLYFCELLMTLFLNWVHLRRLKLWNHTFCTCYTFLNHIINETYRKMCKPGCLWLPRFSSALAPFEINPWPWRPWSLRRLASLLLVSSRSSLLMKPRRPSMWRQKPWSRAPYGRVSRAVQCWSLHIALALFSAVTESWSWAMGRWEYPSAKEGHVLVSTLSFQGFSLMVSPPLSIFQVIEFDKPDVLQKRPGSTFAALLATSVSEEGNMEAACGQNTELTEVSRVKLWGLQAVTLSKLNLFSRNWG